MSPNSGHAPASPRTGEVPVVHVVGVDANADPVLVGIQMHPVRKVHVFFPQDRAEAARRIASSLSVVGIHVVMEPASRGDVVGLLERVVELVHREEGRVLINVGGGWETYMVGALCAAFFTGTRAFTVHGRDVAAVPVLRVAYPEVLSPPKLRILRALSEAGEPLVVKELAEATRLNPSLVSYHLRGSRERDGLEHLGLVESVEVHRRGHAVRLTALGRSLRAVYDLGAEEERDPRQAVRQAAGGGHASSRGTVETKEAKSSRREPVPERDALHAARTTARPETLDLGREQLSRWGRRAATPPAPRGTARPRVAGRPPESPASSLAPRDPDPDPDQETEALR